MSYGDSSFCSNSFKVIQFAACENTKYEPDHRTMSDNDLPHRTSIAFKASRETRKFVNCCSGRLLLHDFLIVSINELKFNGHEKKANVDKNIY